MQRLRWLTDRFQPKVSEKAYLGLFHFFIVRILNYLKILVWNRVNISNNGNCDVSRNGQQLPHRTRALGHTRSDSLLCSITPQISTQETLFNFDDECVK